MIRGLAQRGGNYPKRGDTRRDGGRGGRQCRYKGHSRTANKLSPTPSDKSSAEKYAAILAREHDALSSHKIIPRRGGREVRWEKGSDT